MQFLRYISAVLGFLFSTVIFAANSGTMPLDKVVAIVNDGVVTQSQVDTMVTDMTRAAKSNPAKPVNMADIKKQALDTLIAQTLELQIAARNKLTVSDAQMKEALTNIAKQNHLTLDQLKTAVENDGINYTHFRNQIHDQLLIRELQQHVFAGKISMSDDEVKAYMKKAPKIANPNTEYHLVDVLVPMSETASSTEISTAEKSAQALRQQAEHAELSQLVTTSTDPTAPQLNDMGWRKASDLPSIFAAQVANMKRGGVAGPIRAANGFHILQLLDLHNESKPLTELEAKNMLFQEKIKDQIDIWIKQIRKSSYVKIM